MVTASQTLKAFCGYSAALALAFLLAAVPAHVLMAHQYRVAALQRLKIIAHDGEEAVERVPSGRSLRPALASALKSPEEGLVWYDAAGAPVARAGTTSGGVMTYKARVIEETANGWIEATMLDSRIGSAVTHLDLGLGIGMLIAALGGGLIITVISSRALARVESALKRVHRFTGDAAHELRTPLAVIAANSDPLVADGCNDAACDQRMDGIRQAAGQMRMLVDGLLLLSRADEGVRSDLHVVDLGECAASVVQLHRPAAERRGIALHFHCSSSVTVYGQPDEMARILGNLVENALRYTLRGGSIDVTCERTRNAATVSIADTGIGLRSDELERVFDRFWRAPGQPPGDGSGLGLAIARDLARAHGGDITVRSRSGKGSTFTIQLPCAASRRRAFSTSSQQS